MHNSIHTERWIKQIDRKKNIIGVYPSVSGKPTKYFEKFRKNNIFTQKQYFNEFLFQYLKNNFLNKILLIIIKRFNLKYLDFFFLYICINKFKPDIIHTLEIQHAGYLYLAFKKLFNLLEISKTKWILTNWGSDIYFFEKYNKHKKLISQCLNYSNFYSAECSRDYELAKKYNNNINFLPLMPNAGGLNLTLIKKYRDKYPVNDRKIILVKGYVSKFGQADLVLDSIYSLRKKLVNYKIIFYSSSRSLINKYNKYKDTKILDITFFNMKKSHPYMLNLFSRAKVYIGISRSDGLSTSFLEAISLGVFPIQSSTSCCCELITHKKNGFIVDQNDTNNISEAIQFAIDNSNVIKNAYKINWDLAKNFLDEKRNIKIANSFYEK